MFLYSYIIFVLQSTWIQIDPIYFVNKCPWSYSGWFISIHSFYIEMYFFAPETFFSFLANNIIKISTLFTLNPLEEMSGPSYIITLFLLNIEHKKGSRQNPIHLLELITYKANLCLNVIF